jgi:hypothetical protein
MTTLSVMMLILGAATVSVNFVRLIDRLEHPTYRRRTEH